MYLLVLPAFFLLFLTPSGYFSAQVSITSNSRLPMKSFVHDTGHSEMTCTIKSVKKSEAISSGRWSFRDDHAVKCVKKKEAICSGH